MVPFLAGVGVAGVYTKEVAETKVAAAERLAEQHEYPLRVSMEPEPEEVPELEVGLCPLEVTDVEVEAGLSLLEAVEAAVYVAAQQYHLWAHMPSKPGTPTLLFSCQVSNTAGCRQNH